MGRGVEDASVLCFPFLLIPSDVMGCPPQQILSNSIQNHWKIDSFNTFHQSYSWHSMFCFLAVFHN